MFDREGEIERAIEALRRRGFDSDRWEVLNGEGDARSLDLEGDAHGVPGRLTRALQQALSFDRDHVRRHVEHLLAGGYVLAVLVGTDEGAKQRAGESMRDAGGDFVNYYADTYIESL